MGIADLAKATQQFISNNSPSILTGIGVAGVATTAYLAAKAGYKSAHEIIEHETYRGATLSPKEKIQRTWKNFIPAAGVGVTSALAIVGSQRISSRRTATLASLYSLTDRAFTEYRERAVDVLGKRKAVQVQDEIAESRVKTDLKDLDESKILFTGGGETLCYDMYTGRVFYGDIEKIRKAQNDFNAGIITNMYASLNDWYHLIGLPQIDIGETVGFTTDNMMETSFTAILLEGKAILAMHYNNRPKEKFYKIF